MPEKLNVTGRMMKRLRDVSATLPRIEASEVAKTLGAESTSARLEKALAPLTSFFVREKLFERLRSNAIRSEPEGATHQVKILLSDRQWLQLEEIAQAVSSEGFAISAGQVASMLLAAALESASANGNAIFRDHS